MPNFLASRRTFPAVICRTRDKLKFRYAVDVTGGGHGSATSRKISATTFAIWNTPLPRLFSAGHRERQLYVDSSRPVRVDPGRRLRANSGRSPTARRTRQIDPKETFKLGPMNGRKHEKADFG